MNSVPPNRHELILGGARSGKSRTAESRAAAWLAAAPDHRATLVATALAGDHEMTERIEKHRADRAQRIPALETFEAPGGLGDALRKLADPRRLLVVDCLTLWLAQCLMPPVDMPSEPASGAMPAAAAAAAWPVERDSLLAALRDSRSPIVLVSNEISLGVIPMSREAREFVDTLGFLHQTVAGICSRVTLMVAGCELIVKGRD